MCIGGRATTHVGVFVHGGGSELEGCDVLGLGL